MEDFYGKKLEKSKKKYEIFPGFFFKKQKIEKFFCPILPGIFFFSKRLPKEAKRRVKY